MRSIIVCLLALALVSGNEHRRLLFQSEIVDTTVHPQFHQEHTFDVNNNDDSKHQFVVQFQAPLHHEVVEAAEATLGVKFGHYFPEYAFHLFATHEVARRAQSLRGVVWVGKYKPQFKVHATVHRENRVTEVMGFNNTVRVVPTYTNDIRVSFPTGLSLEEIEVKAAELLGRLGEELPIHAIGTEHVVLSPKRVIFKVTDEESIIPVAQWLSLDAHVSLVERRPHYRIFNRNSRSVTQVGVGSPLNAAPKGLTVDIPALSGQGEVVGIADTGLDWKSCFFYDSKFPSGPAFKRFSRSASSSQMYSSADAQHRKVVQYVAGADQFDEDGHGTHTSGSIAGKLWQEGKLSTFNGMAPEAKVAFWDMGRGRNGDLMLAEPFDEAIFPWSYVAGARIHSDSWGASEPVYDSGASEFDSYSWENKDWIGIVAAGNDGQSGSSTAGTPASAKNILSVGAGVQPNEFWSSTYCSGGLFPDFGSCRAKGAADFTENSVAEFSSTGPINDGRLAPTIIAPGHSVISARFGTRSASTSCTSDVSDIVHPESGTSMSTPVVAGNVALIRQYFRDGYWPSGSKSGSGFNPSGALLKAVALNSATALTGYYQGRRLAAPPNNVQGYGRLTLENSLQLSGRPTKLLIQRGNGPLGDPTIATGGNSTFLFCVQGQIGGKPTKVTLVWADYPGSPNTRKNIVNNLDLIVVNVASRQVLNGNGGVDSINTNEQVSIPSGSGTFRAEVIGRNVVRGPQPYALVVAGNVSQGPCSRRH